MILRVKDQVRRELQIIKVRKATGPDGIVQTSFVSGFIHFYQSLILEKFPVLWKTSSVVPVPKIAHPRESNHFRLVALTSHLMRTMERLRLKPSPITGEPKVRPPAVCIQTGHWGG